MKFLKNIFLILAFVQLLLVNNFATTFSFSYTGPTTVTVPFGSSSTNVTYYFSYSYQGTLIRPKLTIRKDNVTLAGAICEGNDTYLPSSYTINFTPGTHSVEFSISDLGSQSNSCTEATIWQTETFSVETYFKVRVENNFTGGSINVAGLTKTSPHDKSVKGGDSFTIGALAQNSGGYDRVWNTNGTNNSKWEKKLYGGSPTFYSYSQNTNYTVSSNDVSTSLIAGLRKICEISFKNSHSGGEVGGSIKVNGTSYTSPTSDFNVVELNGITGEAVNHSINGIDFSFSSWSDGGGTNYSHTFTPSTHKDYEAIFTGRPNNTYRNQYFNPKVVGQPIKVYWSQHPNTSVTQYKVYRKPKYGSESCVGTFARTGTSSYVYTFTDPDMVHTNSSSSNDLYYYDVRAYYSPDVTYSDYDFKAVYAEMGGPIADDSPKEERMQIAEKIYEYGISNYPNPYNPTTTINYQIKEMGNVNITVFDALGRTVKVLVNDIKQPGDYNIHFDGSNLSNGVYYYRMQAGNFVETKKMIMMK